MPIHERHFLDKERRPGLSDKTPQWMTSWSALYHVLLKAFPSEPYFYGHKLRHFIQEEEQVKAYFENGFSDSFHLLVGADRLNSGLGKFYFRK